MALSLLFQIKSSLYSPNYAEACNELRGPSPRLSAWATQLRRNVATVASRWRHCVDLTGPGIEAQTSCTDTLATELTAVYNEDLPSFFSTQFDIPYSFLFVQVTLSHFSKFKIIVGMSLPCFC